MNYDNRPNADPFTREFGVKYATKRVRANGVAVTEATFAPFGDDPLLVDQVTIRTTTRKPLTASWFEYWDANPYDQATAFQTTIGLHAPRWHDAHHTLSVAQQ